MTWGQMKSPRPPASDEQKAAEKLYGERTVSTLDPEVRDRMKRKSLGGHLDDGRHELMQAMRDADALGESVVHQQVAAAVVAVDDAMAVLADHAEAEHSVD